MAQFLVRAKGPTDSTQTTRFVPACVALLAAGCVSYEPAPVDVSQLLADLEALPWEQPAAGVESETDGAGPEQLASFAITHNPTLQAARSRVGVAQALLVEAGLLADPQIGWDAMDVVASQIVDGTSGPTDVFSGLGLTITLPRPGELDAKKGAARWRIEEIRRQVTQAEWVLAREVYVSVESVLEVQRLLAQNQDLLRIAEGTSDYFERAKDAGAATAVQANLAAGDLIAIRAERIRLEARMREARQRLNALLGLTPSTVIPVVGASTPDEPPVDDAPVTPEALVEHSLELRPDLAVLLASYQAAEEDVRLQIALQYPQVSIGTGIFLVPGFFTRFNRPAIETAWARREVLRGVIEARVHEVRREIYDAHASLDESRRQLSFLESELLPNAEESLRMIGEAFDAGEVTLLETLTVQRDLVRARTLTTEVRAELRRRHWRLLAASGTLLVPADAGTPEDDDQETPVR